MKRYAAIALFGSLLLACAQAAPRDSILLPDSTNAVYFRLFTNASPDAPHLFNTFEIEAYGEKFLASPTGGSLQRLRTISPTNASLHSLLVNGFGPQLSPTNSSRIIEQVAGDGWRYVGLDLSLAYHGLVTQYTRGVVFVEPDLFVLHDHLRASEPANFQLLLHPPAATRIDSVWRDLRLDLARASLRINAPSRRVMRAWEQTTSPADDLLPGTTTVMLGPSNRLAQFDVVVVFAVSRGGEKRDFAFKLVESNNAVGARIHRAGLPTIVAFKTDPTVARASVTGFEFAGPVGVNVFRPQVKAP